MIVRGRRLSDAGVPDGLGPSGERQTDDRLAVRLRRYRHIVGASGALVLLLSLVTAAGGIFTSLRPVMLVIFAIVLANVGIFFVRFSRSTGTRQRWVRRHAVPLRMRLLLRALGTDMQVLLFMPSDVVDEAHPRVRVPVTTREGDVVGQSSPIDCDVYFDPERGWPAVIETEDVVYWARG